MAIDSVCRMTNARGDSGEGRARRPSLLFNIRFARRATAYKKESTSYSGTSKGSAVDYTADSDLEGAFVKVLSPDELGDKFWGYDLGYLRR